MMRVIAGDSKERAARAAPVGIPTPVVRARVLVPTLLINGVLPNVDYGFLNGEAPWQRLSCVALDGAPTVPNGSWNTAAESEQTEGPDRPIESLVRSQYRSSLAGVAEPRAPGTRCPS